MDYKTDGEFHTDFLELLAERIKPQLYIELGLYEGYTLKKVAPYCVRSVGVDQVKSKELSDTLDILTCECGCNIEFHKMSTILFCEKILPDLPFADLVFMDASHNASDILADFFHLRHKITVNGMIVVHDTHPENDSYRTPEKCGDAYKLLEFFSTLMDFEALTLPCPPGLTILRKL